MSSDPFQSNDPEMWLQRGGDLGSQGLFQEAVDAFTRAITLNQTYAAAYRDRGMTYYELKQYQAALDDLDRAIAFGSGFTAYALRADVHLALGNFKRAVTDYTEFLKTLERRVSEKDRRLEISVKPLVHRGAAYLGLKDFRRAFSDFNTALDYAGRVSTQRYIEREAYYWRGNGYLSQKKLREALADYDRALALDVTGTYYPNQKPGVEQVERDLRAKREEAAHQLGVS